MKTSLATLGHQPIHSETLSLILPYYIRYMDRIGQRVFISASGCRQNYF